MIYQFEKMSVGFKKRMSPLSILHLLLGHLQDSTDINTGFRVFIQKLQLIFINFNIMMKRERIILLFIMLTLVASQGNPFDEFLNRYRNKQIQTPACFGGQFYDRELQLCKCPDGKRQYAGSCIEQCSGGRVWEPGAQKCICIINQQWNGQNCINVLNKCGPGRVFNANLNQCEQIFSKNCSGGRSLNKRNQCVCLKGLWNGQTCVQPGNPLQDPQCQGAILNEQTGQCECQGKDQKWDGNSCRKIIITVSSIGKLAEWTKILAKAEECAQTKRCSQEQVLPRIPKTLQFGKFLFERARKNPTKIFRQNYEQKMLQFKKKQGYNETSADMLLKMLRSRRAPAKTFNSETTETFLLNFAQSIFNKFQNQDSIINKPFGPTDFSSGSSFDTPPYLTEPILSSSSLPSPPNPSSFDLSSNIPIRAYSNRFLKSQGNEYPNVNEGNSQFSYGNAIFRITYSSGGSILYSFSHKLSQISFCWKFINPNYYIRTSYATSNGFLIVIYEDYTNPSSVYTVVFKAKLNPSNNCRPADYINGDKIRYYKKKGNYVSSRQVNNQLILVTQCENTKNQDLKMYAFQENKQVVFQNDLSKVKFDYIVPQFDQNMVRHVWLLQINQFLGDFQIQEYPNAFYTSTINYEISDLHICSSNWKDGGQHHISLVPNIRPINNMFTTWGVVSRLPSQGLVLHPFQIDQYQNSLRVFSIHIAASGDPVIYFHAYPILRIFDIIGVDQLNIQIPTSFLFFDQFACICIDQQIIIYDTFVPRILDSYVQYHSYLYLHKFGQNGEIIGFGYTTPSRKPFVSMFKIDNAGNLNILDSQAPPQIYQLTENNQVRFSQNFFWQYQAVLIKPETNTVVFGLQNNNGPNPIGMYYLFANKFGCVGPAPPLPCPFPQGLPPKIIPKLHGHPLFNKNLPTQRYQIRSEGGKFFIVSSSMREIQVRQIQDIFVRPILPLPSSSSYAM